MFTVTRYHDISCGHRVFGHESKCKSLHGHNYRVHFHCKEESGALDTIGRVVDFGVIKAQLCMWVEEHWDHKFLLWQNDPLAAILHSAGLSVEVWEHDQTTTLPGSASGLARRQLFESLVLLPFNPTAELMAAHLLNVVGPLQLAGTGIRLMKVLIEETMKCSAIAEF